MKIANHHYSKYLISVHFDRSFLPDTLEGKIEMCENFLYDLGEIALKSGHRLHGTHSVCNGKNSPHAHFAVSWLPTVQYRVKNAKMSNQPIARHPVTTLLEQNFFFVDNPKQAIKRITHDKKFVTDYVIHQPKDGQSAISTGFYMHPILVPVYSEMKMQPYCYARQFGTFKNHHQNGCINKLISLSLISLAHIVLISYFLLSLF